MSTDDGTRYVKSELLKMDGKTVLLKNSQGDIIGTAKLAFIDGELKGLGEDKLTGVRFVAKLVPADKVVDDSE